MKIAVIILQTCAIFILKTESQNRKIFAIRYTSVYKTTRGQLFLGLICGWAYYPGVFYAALFHTMSCDELGLLTDI